MIITEKLCSLKPFLKNEFRFRPKLSTLFQQEKNEKKNHYFGVIW